jgi:hypothetical protein
VKRVGCTQCNMTGKLPRYRHTTSFINNLCVYCDSHRNWSKFHIIIQIKIRRQSTWKRKGVLVHSHRGQEATVPSFLTSAIDGMGGHLHTSAASPQTKSLPSPLNRRLGGPQSQSGHFGKTDKFLVLVRKVLNAQLFKIQCHSNPSLLYGMLLYVATFLRQTADWCNVT